MDIVYYMMAKTQKQKQVQNVTNNSKRQRNSIMETRRLMQLLSEYVCRYYGICITRDTKFPEKYLMEAIRNIRNLDKMDNKTPKIWIKRLAEREFIRKCDYNMYQVLDTGQDWSELK